jgi:hypothetical protein
MALGPREKSELELHWQHQQDHVRADLRDIYRRMQNQVERAAFNLIAQRYSEDGTLIDLRAEPGALLGVVRTVVKELPEEVGR